MKGDRQLSDQIAGRPKIFVAGWKYPRTAATLAVISTLNAAYNVAAFGYHPREGLAILLDFTLYALGGFGTLYAIALLIGWTHHKLWHRTTPD